MRQKEPSFRYRVTPLACAPHDLLVVFPWTLSNVISGSPLLFEPYVVSARYAAEYRNWHWQFKMKPSNRENRAIRLSSATTPYPAKIDPISDEAIQDSGGNFGRLARTGLLDAYMARPMHEELSGIPIYAWQRFLAAFSQDQAEDKIMHVLDQIVAEADERRGPQAREVAERLLDAAAHIISWISSD